MTHLSDEQFEDILAGGAPEPSHLVQCDRCGDKLAELRAMRSRLRSAFASVHPSAELLSNIQGNARQAIIRKTSVTPPRQIKNASLCPVGYTSQCRRDDPDRCLYVCVVYRI